MLKSLGAGMAAGLALFIGAAQADEIVAQFEKKFGDVSLKHVLLSNITVHSETIQVDTLRAPRKHFYVTCLIFSEGTSNSGSSVDLSFVVKDKDGKALDLVFNYGYPLPKGQFVQCGTDNADRVDTPAVAEQADLQIKVHDIDSKVQPLTPSPTP